MRRVASPGRSKSRPLSDMGIRATRTGWRAWRDYASLTKPRVVALLLFTTVTAIYLAGPPLSLWTILFTLLGGYLSAGGAGAINCALDADIDAVMSRTCNRPVPTRRLRPAQAMRFGVILSLLSFAILWWGVNSLTAWLATGGLLFYVLVYTVWLKRRSPHNVVIGGAAGAFPPLVGWAAATGRLDLMAWLLAGIIFFWTPAHFWALALMRRHDYARARVPMLPVVRGDRAGRVQVARYTGLLVLVSITPFALGAMGPLYAAAALGLGMVLVERVTRLLRRADEVATRRYYFCSLFYLALLCLAMMVDRVFFVGP